MSACEAEATSTENADLAQRLERLASTAGNRAIESACRSFRQAADQVCVLQLGSPSPALQKQFEQAAWIEAAALEKDFQRLLRARRLVILVGVEEPLGSEVLARMQGLQRARPAGSVLTLLETKQALYPDALAALERRAWRTLVPDPPANPEGMSVASRGVLIVAPPSTGVSSEHPLNDWAAIAAWLAATSGAADELDRRALLLKAAELQSSLLQATPPKGFGAHSDRWDRLTTRLESKGVDRIERAFDEIDATCATELRLFGEDVTAIARGDRHEHAHKERFEDLLLGAAERFGVRYDGLVRPVLRDLRDEIADDCREAQGQADEQARQDEGRWPSCDARSRFFAHLAAWDGGPPVQIDDRSQLDAALRGMSTDLGDEEPWVRPSTTVAAGLAAGSGFLVLQTLSAALLAWPLAWVVLPAVMGGIAGGFVESSGRRRRLAAQQQAALALAIERHTQTALARAHENLVQATRLHVQSWRRVLTEAGQLVWPVQPTEPAVGATRDELVHLISELQSPPTVPNDGETNEENRHEG